MQSSLTRACAFVLAFTSCVLGCADDPDASTDVAAVTLPVGGIVSRGTFRDRDGDGRGDNFAAVAQISGKARAVRFGVDGNGDQRVGVTLAPCPPAPGPCGFGTNGDGRAILIEQTREARGGQYYKGWMEGRTVGSNNNGSGLCEDDSKASPGREQFRTQLKIWFLDATDAVTGSCYCNVCPREAGQTTSKCNTSQWAIATSLSDDGGCKAPGDTTHVQFAIIGLARDRQPDRDGALLGPEATGTAIFDRYVFARCGDDGFCDDPNILAATAWY